MSDDNLFRQYSCDSTYDSKMSEGGQQQSPSKIASAETEGRSTDKSIYTVEDFVKKYNQVSEKLIPFLKYRLVVDELEITNYIFKDENHIICCAKTKVYLINIKKPSEKTEICDLPTDLCYDDDGYKKSPQLSLNGQYLFIAHEKNIDVIPVSKKSDKKIIENEDDLNDIYDDLDKLENKLDEIERKLDEISEISEDNLNINHIKTNN